MNDKIFMQIASYRDPQLIPTIEDCLANAERPKNLTFGIAWQHDEEESLGRFATDPRFRVIDIPHRETKGACWARRLTQTAYDGETYTLQLDSHHRFVAGWDRVCIDMLQSLQDSGVPKPLLTAYLPSFDPECDPEKRQRVPWRMDFDRFIPEGAVFFYPAAIDEFNERTRPLRARFCSAHFIFTLGQFCNEVPYDPYYYFHGEEINLAVRAFTHGYDLFHPHRLVAWHEYTRKGRTRHWDDQERWYELNDSSHLRNRKFFEMDGETRDVDFGEYDLGTIRTLRDYERYAGINFKLRGVQQHTLNRLEPPCPDKFASEEEWLASFLTIFKHIITVDRREVAGDDHDFWYVGFHDQPDGGGTELFRQDAYGDELERLQKTEAISIEREFETAVTPRSWTVWPHSRHGGWMSKITRPL